MGSIEWTRRNSALSGGFIALPKKARAGCSDGEAQSLGQPKSERKCSWLMDAMPSRVASA
jgi:hypothetical protein